LALSRVWADTHYANGTAASGGGGICSGWAGTVYNTIVYGNNPGGNYTYLYVGMQDGADFVNCRVWPRPNLATACTTNNPRFLNPAADNYWLPTNSPCINAGTNSTWMTNATDLAGLPRLIGGTVDMGCYEQSQDPALGGPVISNPVAVASGATGEYGTTNASFWVRGSKPADQYVVTTNAMGGWVTNNIWQTRTGTLWSNRWTSAWCRRPPWLTCWSIGAPTRT
jgi:hypothetical protein